MPPLFDRNLSVRATQTAAKDAGALVAQYPSYLRSHTSGFTFTVPTPMIRLL